MPDAYALFETTLAEIREAGLYKEERVIVSDQDAEIAVAAQGDAPAERRRTLGVLGPPSTVYR